MKSNKMVSLCCYGISILIFLASFITGVFILKPGEELGYVLLNFYMIMPLTSFGAGITMGVKNGFLKWIYPFVIGILGLIIPALVFPRSFDWFAIYFAFIPASIGLLIGVLIRFLVNKLSAKK